MSIDAVGPRMPPGSAAARAHRRVRDGRWVVLALVWAAFLVSFVDRLAWGNVAASVGESLGLQIAALNIFVTAFYAGYVVSNLVSGPATDWLGGRWMLTLALVPLGLFTFMFSITSSVEFGLVLQALMGIAAGADYAAGMKLIAAWFGIRDRGRAMGLYFTAPTLGVIVTNAMVPVILQAFTWSVVYEIFGLVTILVGVACCIMLRDGPTDGGGAVHVERPVERSSALALVRNRDLIVLTVAGFGAMWGSWGFAFWVNALMIRGHNISPLDAGSIVALFGIGALVGNPMMGVLSDWLGGRRRLPIIACLSFFVVMLLVFGGLETETQFRLAAPLMGIAAFAYLPLLGAMVTEAAGVRLAGSASGITNACWQLGTILVPIVVGVVFQATDSFYAAFVAIAAGPLLSAVSMLFVREQRHADQ
jgi:sugar phosphate permease